MNSYTTYAHKKSINNIQLGYFILSLTFKAVIELLNAARV